VRGRRGLGERGSGEGVEAGRIVIYGGLASCARNRHFRVGRADCLGAPATVAIGGRVGDPVDAPVALRVALRAQTYPVRVRPRGC